VSEANADYIAQTFGVPRTHIRVIPCGVDTSRFRPGEHRPELPHIVCVARLVPVKNLRLLLETCACLRARGLDFRCVLIGEGPCREDLLALRTRLDLEGIVEMAGAAEQGEVCTWWQRATVALLTSEREGMPVCLMEAASCGVPAVATAVGGVPELVEDGVTGLLAPAGDAQALADCLERVLRDPSLAARLGAAARRHAEERFDVRQQVDRLLRLWSVLMPREGEAWLPR
jgi:glycosyltransferase involved in cell wall biosynthesis